MFALFGSGEVLTDWKRGNITPFFKKGGKKKKVWVTAGKSVSPLYLTRLWSRIFWRPFKALNDKVIGDNQCDFTKGGSCLTNLVAFCDEVVNVCE